MRLLKYANPGLPIVIFLVLISLLIFGVCSDKNSTNSNDNGSSMITPENGGTVSDPNGTTLVVPPGAVSENTDITITTYSHSADLPFENGAIPYFIGGADLGPDGLIFQVPATLTLTSNIPLTPGDNIPLYMYDETAGEWTSTGFVGVVNSDGYTFSAEITHFSLFGSFGGGVFDNFSNNFGDGSNADAAFAAYIEWFHANVARVDQKGMYEGECQKVTGIHFDLSYEVHILPDGPVYQGAPYVQEGTAGDHQISFTETVDIVTGEIDKYYSLSIDVFIECSAPDLATTAEPSEIDVGETSTVTATLTCGGDPMPGQEVTFEATAGLGTLSDESVTTSSGGQAQTVFTAEDEGRESIHVQSVSCDGSESVDASPNIEIGGYWSGTISWNFNQDASSAGWVFSDGVSIDFDLQFDETTISGTGDGSHNMIVTGARDCWIEDESAPPFTAYVQGTKVGESLNFQVIPNSMPVSFTLACPNGDDPPIRMPIPIYSNLEGSTMGQVEIELPLLDGASTYGSGSEGDPPFEWNWSVTINSGDK